MFPDKVLDSQLGAPPLAREADLHLLAPGQERVPEAMALPHKAHQDISEVLWAYPAFTGVFPKAALTIPDPLAKALVPMVWVARMA